mgnify:CR=1 FL=1
MSRTNLAVKVPAACRMPEAKALLAWYDRHRRDLPWRAKPGGGSEAYRGWVSENMLPQTRVETGALLRSFPGKIPDRREARQSAA